MSYAGGPALSGDDEEPWNPLDDYRANLTAAKHPTTQPAAEADEPGTPEGGAR